MNTTKYKLERGDTVRITGCHGRLFSGSGIERKLAAGVELGVECVLLSGEDADLDVGLPAGILANGMRYIHMACVELVKTRESKPATIVHTPKYKIFEVLDGADKRFLSKIWYESIPKEVAEKYSKAIKEAYDTSVSNNPPIRDLLELL